MDKSVPAAITAASDKTTRRDFLYIATDWRADLRQFDQRAQGAVQVMASPVGRYSI